jgi:HK97 gp10 family phage protein
MTLEGMDALKRAVTEAPQELRRHGSDAVRDTTNAVADRMRRRVSAFSKTGTLLQEIEAKVPVRSGLMGTVSIGPDAFYWRFIEYGTRYLAARPFVRPSTEEEADPYIGRWQEVARKLERWWGK